MASYVITRHLVAALRGTDVFLSGDHSLLMREGRDDIRRRHTVSTETELGEAQSATSMEDALWMVQITRMGAWMSLLTSTVNGKEKGVQEWSYSLFLIYGIYPPDLPEHYVG